MLNLAEEVTGKRELPGFSVNLIWDAEAAYYLSLYHELMMKGTGGLGKEEALDVYKRQILFPITWKWTIQELCLR